MEATTTTPRERLAELAGRERAARLAAADELAELVWALPMDTPEYRQALARFTAALLELSR